MSLFSHLKELLAFGHKVAVVHLDKIPHEHLVQKCLVPFGSVWLCPLGPILFQASVADLQFASLGPGFRMCKYEDTLRTR
ncbi:hypothetical protein Ciccas_012913 [Cichlidogyrus casuarinus]|uniref:Uncharacterized protein n=1 Tax=Cichlidogyrus casuarinus TaxID=1844966 RepID=A0ABD2PNF2_9PLAT